MKSLPLFFIVLFPYLTNAKLQGQARIDSLLKELPAANKDTGKVKLLDDLAYAYKTINPDSGIKYAREELVIATELQWKKGIAGANSKLGLNYEFKYEYPRALEYNLKALKQYEELNDKSGTAAVHISLAHIYSQMSNFDKALEYDMSALRIFDETNDKANSATTQGNIGNIYQVLQNYDKALEYDLSALKSFEELDDKSGIARNLGNIGNIYLLRSDYAHALEYNFKSLGIFEALGEKYGIGLMSGNIGEIYLTIARDTTSKVTPGKHIPADKKKILALAIDYLEKGSRICREISMMGGIIEFGQHLAKAYAMDGNFRDALTCSRQYTAIKDSIFSQRNIEKMALIDGKREKDIKQKQIEVQQLKIVAVRTEKRLYIAGLAMLVLLSGGLFLRFRTARKTKRQLEEKNRIIAAEKENADMLRVRAESSEKFKQQFLANMSHEIRTPMNALNGMTDLLLNKSPRPDQVHYLEVISRSSDILLHIINDILDLSKIESGKLELEAIDFSLAETIRQVKETLSFRAEEKGLRLTTVINGDIPPVLVGDPFRLNQVLINLGGNAIKFTEIGSVEINVSLEKNDGKEAKVLFAVADTGIGIPEDKLETVFESFKQVQNSDSRKYGGTGLGLSISKQLIELQGGKISVKSELGRGTVFYFTISYPVGSQQRLRERTADEQRADGRLLNGMRILLADDNDYNRMVASETLLMKSGVVIDEAVNGEEAVRLLEANNYDVVLMDIQMPVMNGLEATRHIRKKLSPPKSDVPIIALTASMLRTDVDMYSDAGMNTFVPKPFKAWQLISAIAEVTGRKAENTSAQPEPGKGDVQYFEPGLLVTNGITDLTYLHKFCEGDKDRMKKFIKLYIASVPVFVNKVNMAMAADNKDEIATQVHAFKPRWMMMGMKQSAELGIKIEKQIKEQSQGELTEHICMLIAQTESSVGELSVIV